MTSATGPETAVSARASLPTLRRVLTGRDESGKSVFKSVDVTPRLIAFESRPVAIWMNYVTEGVPALTGHEPDPMLSNPPFPGPGDTGFAILQFPPRPPEGTKPDPAVFVRFADEIEKRAPGWKEHFAYAGQPGMHTTETVDYVTVLRGELILELDDGNSVHLYPGDCVIQNGTAHRWINPLPEPAMVATIFVGGKRESK